MHRNENFGLKMGSVEPAIVQMPANVQTRTPANVQTRRQQMCIAEKRLRQQMCKRGDSKCAIFIFFFYRKCANTTPANVHSWKKTSTANVQTWQQQMCNFQFLTANVQTRVHFPSLYDTHIRTHTHTHTHIRIFTTLWIIFSMETSYEFSTIPMNHPYAGDKVCVKCV